MIKTVETVFTVFAESESLGTFPHKKNPLSQEKAVLLWNNILLFGILVLVFGLFVYFGVWELFWVFLLLCQGFLNLILLFKVQYFQERGVEHVLM